MTLIQEIEYYERRKLYFESEIEALKAKISRIMIGWYGISSTVIPEGVDSHLDQISSLKNTLEKELEGITSTLNQYSPDIIKRFGEDWFQTLKKFIPQLNYQTKVWEVDAGDSWEYIIPTEPYSVLDRYNLEYPKSVNYKTRVVRFDHYRKDNREMLAAGYAPEINTLVVRK